MYLSNIANSKFIILCFLLFIIVISSCSNDDDIITVVVDPEPENIRLDGLIYGYYFSHSYQYSNEQISSQNINTDEWSILKTLEFEDDQIKFALDTWTDDVSNQNTYYSEYLYENEMLTNILSQELFGSSVTSLSYNDEGNINEINLLTIKDWSLNDSIFDTYILNYNEELNVDTIFFERQVFENDVVIGNEKYMFAYEFDDSTNPYSDFNQLTILTLINKQYTFLVGVNPFSQNNLLLSKRFDMNSDNALLEVFEYQYDYNDFAYPDIRRNINNDTASNRVRFNYEFY